MLFGYLADGWMAGCKFASQKPKLLPVWESIQRSTYLKLEQGKCEEENPIFKVLIGIEDFRGGYSPLVEEEEEEEED